MVAFPCLALTTLVLFLTPNYVKVYLQGDDLHNQVRPVTVTEVYRDGVLGILDKQDTM